MARHFCKIIALAQIIYLIASMGSSAFAIRGDTKRDDPYGCRAKIRGEMGIPRNGGYAFPEFGPRVRKCVLANGGSPQQTAQSRISPAIDKVKQSHPEKLVLAKTGVTDRGQPADPQPLKGSPAQSSPSIPSAPVDPGIRVALVIGNGAYRQVPTLRNPPRDASDVAAVLRRLGFAVTLANDLSLERTREAVAQFGKIVADSDIALIFYAGHGIEAFGENWMIPVDARVLEDGDMRSEAVNLKSLSAEVAKSKSLGLIILDACRDNPFAPTKTQTLANSASEAPEAGRTFRSLRKGLAPTEPSGNVLIAFAAKDGTTASDGEGRNSPFTSALLKHIETPGLEVSFLFRRVRDDVISSTNGAQQPYVYGSLSRAEIFLKPAAPMGAVGAIR